MVLLWWTRGTKSELFGKYSSSKVDLSAEWIVPWWLGLRVDDHADLLTVVCLPGIQCCSCLPPAHYIGRAAEDVDQSRHENIHAWQQVHVDKRLQSLIASDNKAILIRRSSES